jgi:hypothetical protein
MVTELESSFTKVTAESQLRETQSTHATAVAKLASVSAHGDTSATELAEADALRASLDAILASARQIAADLQVAGRQGEFSPALERCRLDARASLAAATSLHEGVLHAPRATREEASAIAVIARETLEARDYHRERARQLFTVLLATIGAASLVVAVAFLVVDGRSGPWASGIGRAALLGLAAWGLRVVASAYARHTELATFHQDRRASLDTATLLLRSGTPEVREQTWNLLLDGYMTTPRAASAPKATTGSASFPRREVKQLITLVAPQRMSTPTPTQPNLRTPPP